MTPDGRFMVAVRAVIQHKESGKLLLLKNSENHKQEWTMVSGRMKQLEGIEDALKREIKEETGIENIEIQKLLSVWHGFRGEKTEEYELISITFLCITNKENVMLSEEHIDYKWVMKDEMQDYLPSDFFPSNELQLVK